MQRVSKVLFLRFSSIGDIVLTTPVIRATRHQLPGVEIHYATKAQYASIIESNTYVDKVHKLTEKGLRPLIAALKAEQFDFVVDLHRNIRTTTIKRMLGKPSATFDKLNVQKWMMVNLKVDRLPDEHIVDRMHSAVAPLGVKADGGGLNFTIPHESGKLLEQLPEKFNNGFNAMVIGAKFFTKQMPLSLLQGIADLASKPLVLIGGPEDREKAAQIKGDQLYNGCGIHDLTASAMLINAAGKVVSPDTGMMHIAAALQKPVLSVWGSTIPEFGMYPWYGRSAESGPMELLTAAGSALVQTELGCRPCSKLGYASCPKGHFNCMNLVQASEIADWLNSA